MFCRRSIFSRQNIFQAGVAGIVGLGLSFAAPLARAQDQKPQPQLTHITVELGDVSLTKLPFIMAADNGLFEKNGLKADLYITPRAAAAVRGSGVIVPPENIRGAGGPPADFSITGGAYNVVNMTTIATTPPRLILATMDDKVHFHILTRKDITSLDQIKGKRIGFTVPGSVEQLSMRLWLKTRHWNPDHDVSFYLNGGDVGAILKNQVDVIVGDGAAIDAAKKAGLHDLLDLSKFNWPMPGSSILGLASWLPNNRDTTMRFMKATLEAIALMKNDRNAAYASFGKWFGIKDPSKLAVIYSRANQLPSKPYPSIAGLKLMRTVFSYRALDITKPEDFVDASYIKTLDKSGFIDGLYKKSAAR
jgi:ABC-type nitrate/sulfonate/bicarbonate transport system substrate-binding protein